MSQNLTSVEEWFSSEYFDQERKYWFPTLRPINSKLCNDYMFNLVGDSVIICPTKEDAESVLIPGAIITNVFEVSFQSLVEQALKFKLDAIVLVNDNLLILNRWDLK